MQQESVKLIRSFGRIKSRKLSDHKKHLLTYLLPKHQFDQLTTHDKWHSEASNLQSAQLTNHETSGYLRLTTILEIGFGFGDFFFAKAKSNPDKIFFGCEPHLNGVVNLLSKLEVEPLPNVKITTQDSRLILQDFPQNFFAETYILFPDPWPKAKHYKRRLVTAKFLDEVLSPKMQPGAKLVIATDHDSYKTWILSEILHSKKFSWTANSKKDWQVFPDDWVKTKYQKKAEAEGRVPVIFNLIHQ
ncbi:MAG: tRNA (guanosine(46)-N7)-methyltransferase TrmB [Alphaproteobacteria bacterium]|nr:tRNA (guanosine(46)-N7)-methyltransferase TrmB [Alphaproteobacteria bacterium]